MCSAIKSEFLLANSIYARRVCAAAPPHLRSKEHHIKSDPACYHADRRVRADEHERKEFVACAEDMLVAQRAVGDQRDGDGDVEEGEAVEEEVAGIGRAAK